MLTGLLWFNSNPKEPLEQKIQDAVLYYRRKYERMPELCLINAETQSACPELHEVKLEGQTITVRVWRSTPVHHFWLGVEERVAA